MSNIINWDENPLAQELEKERAVSTRLINERDKALAELDRLTIELAQAISERTPHDYGILKDQRDDYRNRLCASINETQEARAEVERLEIINKEVLEANYTMGTTRPEPSRLEIAAMLKAGWLANPDIESLVDEDAKWWHEEAQKLIDAGKEMK
jgi:hypothetical protein